MFKISKTAKAVAVCIEGKKFGVGTKNVAQLVGQFTGADHGYLPGATFVTMELFKTYGLPGVRCVHLLNKNIGRGFIKWFYGATFRVYKVISATPRQVTVRYITEYDAYGWHFRGCDKFDPRDLDGLFEKTDMYPITKTFRVNYEKQDFAHQQFEKLKLETAEKFKSCEEQVRYDVLTETLVICRYRIE
jgi:hypothetical protein